MLHPIDIITRNNRRTGRISDPEDASNRGLWHRGVHVIIATPSGRLLVQKRSEKMIQHPGMLDIGVGGFVDSGETPEMAGIREIYEETGLKATTDQLIFLGVTKTNRHWRYKNRQKISRAFIYSYALRLPSENNDVSPQHEEVSWIGFLPAKSASWLIHQGSLRRFGKLLPTYAYYRKVVYLAKKQLVRQ